MLEYNCCGGGGKYDGNNGRAGIDWLYPYHDQRRSIKEGEKSMLGAVHILCQHIFGDFS